MKSFGQKAWVLPQPVLIIGTYNSDGTQRTILCQRGNDFLPTFYSFLPTFRLWVAYDLLKVCSE